jgi:hypothetical protein
MNFQVLTLSRTQPPAIRHSIGSNSGRVANASFTHPSNKEQSWSSCGVKTTCNGASEEAMPRKSLRNCKCGRSFGRMYRDAAEILAAKSIRLVHDCRRMTHKRGFWIRATKTYMNKPRELVNFCSVRRQAGSINLKCPHKHHSGL